MYRIKIVVPCGSPGAGAGVGEREVRWTVSQGRHAIATDAGSTDSGSAYLAPGKSTQTPGGLRSGLPSRAAGRPPIWGLRSCASDE